MWFIGVEVAQETSAPPPKKNPGSAPANTDWNSRHSEILVPFDSVPFFKMIVRCLIEDYVSIPSSIFKSLHT